MNELPELLPRIEENIANIGSNIDMNAVQDMANQAADQISEVIRDPTITGIRVNVVNGNRMFQENLPYIMQAMGNTLFEPIFAIFSSIRGSNSGSSFMACPRFL
jgi:hypothetical protein